MNRKIDIDACIACAERELKMRERVYPRRVSDGKMRSDTAAREIATQRDVISLLTWLARNRETVRRVSSMSDHAYRQAVADHPASRAVTDRWPDAVPINPDELELEGAHDGA